MSEPTKPAIPERLWMLWDNESAIWMQADDVLCDGPEYLVFVTEEDAESAADLLRTQHSTDCSAVQVKVGDDSRIWDELVATRRHVEALDRNWQRYSDFNVDCFRKSLDMPDATIPDMLNKISELQALAPTGSEAAR